MVSSQGPTFCINVLMISSLGRRPSWVTRILPWRSNVAVASVTLCALLAYPFRLRAEEMASIPITRQAPTDYQAVSG